MFNITEPIKQLMKNISTAESVFNHTCSFFCLVPLSIFASQNRKSKLYFTFTSDNVSLQWVGNV